MCVSRSAGRLGEGLQFRKPVASCHSPSNSREVGDPHTEQQFASLINISDLSLVVCFAPKSEVRLSKDLLHGEFAVARRLLEPQTLRISKCLALPGPILLTTDNGALESLSKRIDSILPKSVENVSIPESASDGSLPLSSMMPVI